MLDDLRAQSALQAALHGVAVPAFDGAAIRRRVETRRAERRHTAVPFARFASAAAVAVLAVLAVAVGAPAVIQSVESRLQAALTAAGAGPGVRVTVVPSPIAAQIRSRTVTIEEARRLANFTIVEPSGLPPGVRKRDIVAAPLAVWSTVTHAWSIDGEQITFEYERANGRTFSMIADRYTPKAVVPRYMYVVDDGTEATTLAQVRHENFTWRNGDQALSVIADATIDAREIAQIRNAMHGTELPSYTGRPPHTSRVVRFSHP
jgi:hypothetical protein